MRSKRFLLLVTDLRLDLREEFKTNHLIISLKGYEVWPKANL